MREHLILFSCKTKIEFNIKQFFKDIRDTIKCHWNIRGIRFDRIIFYMIFPVGNDRKENARNVQRQYKKWRRLC